MAEALGAVDMYMMRQSAVGFYSGKLELEGVVASPQDSAADEAAAVVVCHSHPALGGNMNGPLVGAICQSAVREGMYTLRFNFRGVGGSGGDFTNGQEESRDIQAALDVMRHWPGVSGKRVAVVGYSTTTTIMLDGFRRLKRASALAMIAPTLGALRSRGFSRDRRPRLVIAGSEDRVAPSLKIQRVLDDCRGPTQFHEIVGADHSMRGHHSQIGDAVADFLRDRL